MLISRNELYEHYTIITFFLSHDPLPKSVPMDPIGLVACFRSQSIV